MNTIYTIFGQGEDLTILQMSARAIVMFFISLLLIRLGGMRVVGKRSAFDTIITITMGSVLARGVVGASPFFSTIGAATCMIAINRLLAWGGCAHSAFDGLVKGKALLLYKDGEILWHNMKLAALSKADLVESLRLETKSEDLSRIQKAYLETNGRISFILKSD
jgi:uncharacterized membrane protein YcaP (DUF421 family)